MSLMLTLTNALSHEAINISEFVNTVEMSMSKTPKKGEQHPRCKEGSFSLC